MPFIRRTPAANGAAEFNSPKTDATMKRDNGLDRYTPGPSIGMHLPVESPTADDRHHGWPPQNVSPAAPHIPGLTVRDNVTTRHAGRIAMPVTVVVLSDIHAAKPELSIPADHSRGFRAPHSSARLALPTRSVDFVLIPATNESTADRYQTTLNGGDSTVLEIFPMETAVNS